MAVLFELIAGERGEADNRETPGGVDVALVAETAPQPDHARLVRPSHVQLPLPRPARLWGYSDGIIGSHYRGSIGDRVLVVGLPV